MKAARQISMLVMISILFLALASLTLAQDHHDGNLAERQKAPTVLGGTGLFNTFSTRTLCKGEFNFALFWNNFDRDPGDIDVNQVPFNFTIGLTNRWEVWVDWVTWQNTTSRQPFLLSGYQYNAAHFFGDPFTLFGPPVGGKEGPAAFFPGTGSLVGGILPALGRFGTPIGFPSSVFSPAGSNGKLVRGLGPLFNTIYPSYSPEFPFFGEVDFQGFDSLGRPVFGPRESSNGSGDIFAGSSTPRLIENDPWEMNLGLRFFFKDGRISFGGGYRRFLNNEESRTIPVFQSKTIFIQPPFFIINPLFSTVNQTFGSEGENGFVAYINIGSRRPCPPPPAPTCVLAPSATSVNRGERLTLTTTPTTPGYTNDKVTYEYRWEVKDATGRPVTVSGTGASVDVATTGIPCGHYTVTTTVTASVPAVDCPSNCVTTGQTTCTVGFGVTEPPCPTVTCDISATPQ